MTGKKSTFSAEGSDPIAEGLRRLYQGVESEPVPEDFLNLLRRIDAAIADPAAGDEGS